MTALLFTRAVLKKRPLRLVFIALCALACFVCRAGLDIAAATLQNAENLSSGASGFGDVRVYFEETENGVGELLSSLGASDFSEGRKASLRCLCADGERRTVRFYAFSGNVLHPEFEGDFALSFGYAADFGADALRFLTLPDGSKLEISALACVQGFNAVYADRFTVSTDGDIADVFTTEEKFTALFGGGHVCFAAADFPAGTDLDGVLDALNAEKCVEYAEKSENNPAYAASHGLLCTVLRVCRVLPDVICAVGLVFECVFLSGVARRMHSALALLMTDGAGFMQLFAALFLTGLVPMAAGLVLSVPGAVWLASGVSRASAGNMGVFYPGLVLSALPFAKAALLCAGMAAASALASLALFSGGSIRERKDRVPSRVKAALSDAIVTAVSFAAAMFLITLTLLVSASLREVRRELFESRYGFGVQVIYSRLVPVTELEALREIPGAKACEPILAGTGRISFRGRTLELSGVGLPEDGSMLRFFDENGAELKPGANSVILDTETAKKLGAKKGDLVTVEVSRGGKRLTALCGVAAISRQHSAFTQIVSADTVEEYLDSSGVMNSALVRVEGDVGEFSRRVSSLPDVYAVQTGESAEKRFDRRYGATLRLMRLITADGILLGFSVCMLMGYASWRRNVRKNAILIQLGEAPLVLAARDAAVRAAGMLAGLVLSLCAGKMLLPRVLEMLSTDTVSYPAVYPAGAFLAGAALTVGFTAVSIVFCAILNAKSARTTLRSE